MILIASMCVRIPPSPDNFKGLLIKYQIFEIPFYSGFESVASIVFSFETNFNLDRDPFKVSYQTVATIKGNIGFESVANIVFSFDSNFNLGRNPFKVIRL